MTVNLTREQKDLESRIASVKRLEESVRFYTDQIVSARIAGRDEFDSEKYKVAPKPRKTK